MDATEPLLLTDVPTPQDLPSVMPKYTILLMNTTQFALNFAVLLLRVIMIPYQVEMMASGDLKGRALGVLVGIQAVVIFIGKQIFSIL